VLSEPLPIEILPKYVAVIANRSTKLTVARCDDLLNKLRVNIANNSVRVFS